MTTTKKKVKKNPKGKTLTRPLPFKLNDEEKAARGLEAAKLNNEIAELTVKKKLVTDEFAGSIKDRTARRNTLLKQIHDGLERRDSECTEVKNFDENKVEYWVDGQMLESREMTPTDRQLDLDEAKKDTKKKGSEVPAGASVVAPPTGDDVKNVIAEETNRKTKTSAVDGARA
jgi:hypothetical protein